MYATVKKEVPRGMFRRPDAMHIIEDEKLDNLERKGDEDLKQARFQEESKNQTGNSSADSQSFYGGGFEGNGDVAARK